MTDTKKLMKIVEDVSSIEDKSKASEEKAIKQFSEMLENIDFGNDDISKPLIELLALPDEEFKVIAPIILMNINQTFHDSNNQLVLLRTFNANGTSLEELMEQINAMIEEIDSTKDFLSQQKIDFMKQIFMDMYNAISEINGIPKKVIEIPIERCHENAKIPCYANPTDSGMDIYALEDITIAPGETKLIPTGLKVAIPVGYELQVRPKSGRALKTKLRVANTPGTIDSGYRDEIGVIIDNIEPPIRKIYMNDNGTIAGMDHGSSYTIGKGEKFAQLVLCEISHCAFNEIESVAKIENDGRKGGFGSTGLK